MLQSFDSTPVFGNCGHTNYLPNFEKRFSYALYAVLKQIPKVKVKKSHHRPGQAQRVPGG
jgi:hypothetical protein